MKKIFFLSSITIFLACLMYSCANRGMGPQGGPKDITPPSVLSSSPAENAKNYNKKTVEINFDEFILLEKPYENVIISPPQKKSPVIKSVGKKLIVEISDTLQKNTTYTIDFGNSITDNNEKNILENYSFAFSTGNDIDSLSIVGTLVDASSLNPVAGSLVGIYSNLSDTAFTSLPFLRTTKTNEKGEFFIKNVKDGAYRLFALSDMNSNFYFDQASEAIAFDDSVVNPIFIPKKKTTTDSTKTDSISVKTDKLILFQFKEEFKPQYFVKAEQKDKEKFSLFFNAPLVNLPVIKGLNFDFNNSQYLVQANTAQDTITYWLTDKDLINKDTLNLIFEYPKSDSLRQLVMTKDTLHLTVRKEVKQEKKSNRSSKKEAVKTINYLTYTSNIANGALEYYDFVRFKFDSPIKQVDVEKIKLSHLIDTTWVNENFKFNKTDKIGIEYELSADFKAGEKYKINLDSAAITNIYDRTTEKKTFDIKVRAIEEYTTLIVNVSPFNPKAILQLINEKEQVIAEEKADANGTVFEYVNPGTYFLKLFIDENNDGKWDTGNYKENRQAEKTYYFNKRFSLRANWEVEETWDYLLQNILNQKPDELKPKEETTK